MLDVNRDRPRAPAPHLVVRPAKCTGMILRKGAVPAKRFPDYPCALRADASARKPRSSSPLPTRASRARRLTPPAHASADVLTGIARLESQAHLGVRLKKDGYKVIGADWKKQEYFEEVTPPPPPSSSDPLARMPPGLRESGRQERVGQGVAVHCASAGGQGAACLLQARKQTVTRDTGIPPTLSALSNRVFLLPDS